MSTLSTDPLVELTLRARVAALTEAVGTLAWVADQVVGPTPEDQVSAWVAAVHRGGDPALAIARAKYGARAWDDLGPLAIADVRARDRRLAEVCADIPRASRLAVRPQESQR